MSEKVDNVRSLSAEGLQVSDNPENAPEWMNNSMLAGIDVGARRRKSRDGRFLFLFLCFSFISVVIIVTVIFIVIIIVIIAVILLIIVIIINSRKKRIPIDNQRSSTCIRSHKMQMGETKFVM